MVQLPSYSDSDILAEIRQYFPTAATIAVVQHASRHMLYRAVVTLRELDGTITITRGSVHLPDPPDTTSTDIGLADGDSIWWFSYHGSNRSGFLEAIPDIAVLKSAPVPLAASANSHQPTLPAPPAELTVAGKAIAAELQTYFPSARAIYILERDTPWCRYRAAIHLSELELPFLITHSPAGKAEPPDLDDALACVTDESGADLIMVHYKGNDSHQLNRIFDRLFTEVEQLPPR